MPRLPADESDDREFWDGIGRALRGAVLAGLALLGLFGAAQAEGDDPIGYAIGLGAFIVAVLLLFLQIKRYFDGAPPWRLRSVLIDDFDTLAVGLPLLVLLGLAGLFLAAADPDGVGYYAGLGLAAASVLICFGSIKACFDARERGG